jgi:anti-anti-sigma factor
MNITVNVEGDVNLVSLEGNLDISASEQFDSELGSQIDGGARKIILDFSGVKFVASTGLRMILKAAQRMKAENGLLHICCVNETVMEVFQMTGFDTILAISDTVETAKGGMA